MSVNRASDFFLKKVVKHFVNIKNITIFVV